MAERVIEVTNAKTNINSEAVGSRDEKPKKINPLNLFQGTFNTRMLAHRSPKVKFHIHFFISVNAVKPPSNSLFSSSLLFTYFLYIYIFLKFQGTEAHQDWCATVKSFMLKPLNK